MSGERKTNSRATATVVAKTMEGAESEETALFNFVREAVLTLRDERTTLVQGQPRVVPWPVLAEDVAKFVQACGPVHWCVVLTTESSYFEPTPV